MPALPVFSRATVPYRGEVTAWWFRTGLEGFIALCLIGVIDASVHTSFLTFIAVLMIAKNLPAGWAALSVPLAMVGGMAGKLACGFLAERRASAGPS
ncbi:MAG: hypothetical protein ACYDAA_18115 [Syntrophales bacterium]